MLVIVTFLAASLAVHAWNLHGSHPRSLPAFKLDSIRRSIVQSVAAASVLTAFTIRSHAEEDFITTESGLKYRDTKVGDGALPKPGDTVKVHYTGWLDGFESEKKFDSSYDRRSPLQFKVGTRQVISGWDEALLTDMKVGTKRQVIIPPELGYWSRGAGGVIPPGATLYFNMELVGVVPK